MAFTMIAWSESQDTAAVLTQVAGVPDQHVRVELDNIIVPRGMNYLAAAYVLGVTLTQAQLESPSLRRTVLMDLVPLDVAALPATGNFLVNMLANPIPLDEDEALRALVAEGAAGAERETVVVWLSDGPLVPVEGEIFTVRAQGVAVLVPFTWSNAPLVFTQALPAGRYQVVGMRAESATAIAARCVFVGGTWRPGTIGAVGPALRRSEAFRGGRLGVWGEFDHSQPPSVDFLATAADVAERVWFDLIRIG